MKAIVLMTCHARVPLCSLAASTLWAFAASLSATCLTISVAFVFVAAFLVAADMEG